MTDIASYFQTYGENPTDWTQLHEDLKPYYEKRAGSMGWPMLRSPFVYQVPFFSWKIANDSYLAKRRKVAELTLKGNYRHALWFYERPYRLGVMQAWMEQGIDVRPFFAEAWRDTELPDSELAKPMYGKMFREMGFVTDVEGLKFEDLPSHVTVYRGSLQRWRRGLAWTRSLATAKFFAGRTDGAKVWETTVARKAILAWLDGRGEQEVVLRPRSIKEVREVV
jgi:hypothetical protein